MAKVYDKLALTPKQAAAVKRMEEALSECNSAGVYMFGCENKIFAVNKRHVADVVNYMFGGDVADLSSIKEVKATCYKGFVIEYPVILYK